MENFKNFASRKSLAQRKLLLSGDVETNPGPSPNFVNDNIRKKIVRLEHQRQKQSEKQKTCIRRMREYKRQNKNAFQCQMETIKEIAGKLTSPNVLRTATYTGLNILSPGTGTSAAAVIEGSRMLNTIDKVQATVDSLSQQLPNTLQSYDNLASVATITMDTITETLAKISSSGGLLSRIESLISTVTSGISSTTLLISILVIIIAMSWDWKMTTVAVIAVLLLNKWPQCVIDRVKRILFSFTPQMDISSNLYSILGQILFTLMAFFGVSKIPQDNFYDKVIRRLDAIPKAFIGSQKIWEAAGKTFEYVSDEFRVFFLHEKREDLHAECELTKEVNAWAERVVHFHDAKKLLLLQRDAETEKEISALFNQMNQWMHVTSRWKDLSPDCQRILTTMKPQMNDLFKKALRSTVHEGGPRRAPLGVIITGSSGCGKSEMLLPLAYALLNHRGVPVKNIKNEIYVRNYETEYWDSYAGQKIVLFDDAFQMKDSPSNPSPEFMESIRLMNTAPAHIHCADLNDKGRYFSSEICLYTSNLDREMSRFISSVNCPEAALNRLNQNAYRVRPRKEYSKEVVVEKKNVLRIDRNKVINCVACIEFKKKHPKAFFCPHSQVFDRYNILTDEILDEGLSYSQMLQQIYSYDEELCCREKIKLDSYDELLEDPTIFDNVPFTAQMNDEFLDCDDIECFISENCNIGAIDYSVPTDVVAIAELTIYLQWLTQQGIDIDQQMARLAMHPQFFQTYQRRLYCGERNFQKKNLSLAKHLSIARIQFDHHEGVFSNYENFNMTWKKIYFNFRTYVNKLEAELTAVWETSGVVDIIGLVLLSLIMMGMVAVSYHMLTTHKCPICKLDICNCIRVLDNGNYSHFNNIYTPEQFNSRLDCKDLKCENATSSFESPKHFSHLKCENAAGSFESPKHLPRLKCENAAGSFEPPKHLPRLKCENAAGSFEPPKHLPRLKCEHAAGSFELPKHGPRLRCELDDKISESFIPEVYADEGCKALETLILNKNLYALHTKEVLFGNVLFIQGTTFLMNKHFLHFFKRKPDKQVKLFLSSPRGTLMEFTIQELIDNNIPLFKNNRTIDAVLVHLNTKTAKVFGHPSIIKHFITMEDLPALQNGNYNAQMPTYAGAQLNQFYPTKRSFTNVALYNKEEYMDYEDFRMVIVNYWSYFAATVPGDCGAPLILNNNSAMRKIVGIHMASRGFPFNSQGVAQVITQEILREALSKVPYAAQCYVKIDMPLYEVNEEEEIVGSVPMRDGLYVHGIMEKKTSTGGDTKIVESKLHGIFPTLTTPAMLKAKQGLDPMLKGLRKFGKEVPQIDHRLIEMCANDVSNNLVINVSNRNIFDYKRILNFCEAVQGCGDDPFLAPINRSTSMGFPYVHDVKNLRGKKTAFGFDDWTMDTSLAKQIEEDVGDLIQSCREGIQTGVYWSDTLKDERRPIEKVLEGKTRVFCGGPVHFTIAFRQYFLGFAAWLMHNRNANEIATGTNVYSTDWNDIAQKLATRGTSKGIVNVVAGDFANFDGSLSSQILWYILDIINDWYDDGEENQCIRRVLWMHIVNAVHVNGNVVYQATHSQPSGCPITAILNSIYNSIVIRIVYIICARWYCEDSNENFIDMEHFNLFVACVSYGDDNLIGISERILDWFNQITITKAFILIGHEYTDEAKTGILIPVRDISQVAFLKRRFVWDEIANRFIAPLDLKVVLEIVQWTKKGLGSDGITIANLDVTLRELALHEEEIFEKNLAILKQACLRKNIQYRFYTYNEYRRKVLELPFSLEMKQEKKFKINFTNKILSDNYIFIDKRRNLILINHFQNNEKLMIAKIALFSQQRGINIIAYDNSMQTLVDKINVLM